MYSNGYNGMNPQNFGGSNPLADMMKNIDNEPRKMIKRSKDECVKCLFEQFGYGYEIVGERSILKGGFLGIGQKEYYEVKYIVKPRPMTSSEFDQNRRELMDKLMPGGSGSATQFAEIGKKLDDVLKTVEKMQENSAPVVSNSSPMEHSSITEIENLLAKNEFTIPYINNMKNRLRSELSVEQLDDYNLVQQTVFDWIGKSILVYPKKPMKAPHVIVLVGPTGVGKTTTIAKLAGTILLDAKSKNQPRPVIRMITIDHTRVGAEEQLNRFGTLLDVPVDKAECASDVKQIFDAYKNDLDILFIDTPGYSPNDFANIGKMREILGIPGMTKDIYLTVSASVKARDLVSIINVYEQFNYDSMIITKWDETSAFGNVLSVLADKNKPIAYITNGQKVPREIKRATVVDCLKCLDGFSVTREHIDELFGNETPQN